MSKIAFWLVLMGSAAAAQTSNAYLFVAPGGVTSYGHTGMTIQVGGGADALIAKGLGINLELGALCPRQDFSAAVGVFSPGGTYYFRHAKEQKIEPFVNGGYTLMFRYGYQNLFYVGGGVNYWFSRKTGMRFEVRDHVATGYEATHYWGFRIGLALR
jgi:hypothetical protein